MWQTSLKHVPDFIERAEELKGISVCATLETSSLASPSDSNTFLKPMADIKGIHVLIRLLALAATLCATILFAKSYEANYTHFHGFEYVLYANTVASSLGFLVLIVRKQWRSWRVVCIIDLLIMILLVTCLADMNLYLAGRFPSQQETGIIVACIVALVIHGIFGFSYIIAK